MGVAPQPYEDYFGGEPLYGGRFSLPAVQAQPFAAPMALPQFDPIADEAATQQFNAQNAQREAQRDILSGGTDWGSPEGRSKLQQFISRGVIAPQQASAIMRTIPKPQPQNRYSPVPVEVASAVRQLNLIDPSDPQAMSHLQKVIADDSVAPPDIQSHPEFVAHYKELKKEILSQKTHRDIAGRTTSDESMIQKALEAGVDPEEMTPLLDGSGKVSNRVGLMALAAKAKNAPVLHPDAAKRLDELGFQASQPPDDEQKAAWLLANGIPPASATPQQWAQAWDGASAQNAAAYNTYHSQLKAQGHRRLPAPIQPPSAPMAQPPHIPSFNSEQEAVNSGLPKGSIVIIGGRRARVD